jgi:hypothetical protein
MSPKNFIFPVASRFCIPYLFLAMKTLSETATQGAQRPASRHPARSTKKSTWWKRGEHLVQHTPTGTFYCRLKVKGKTIRASLDTDVLTTARLRLPDKLKILRKPKAETGTFGDGRLKYEAETRNGYTSKKNRFVKLAPLSITYRLRCLECLRRSLVETLIHPGKKWKSLSEQARRDAFVKLDAMNARAFTQEHCEAWQSRFSDYAPSVFNNTVNTFRRVLELAGLQGANASRITICGIISSRNACKPVLTCSRWRNGLDTGTTASCS